jgi:ribosome-binding ATPase YchF (GTP1/OBG family)
MKELATRLRRQTKQMVIACNKIDVPGAADSFARLSNDFPDHMLIACSAESELALKEAAKHGLIEYIPGSSEFDLKEKDKLSERQQNALAFIKRSILDKYESTGVQEVLDKAVFELLRFVPVYPVANSRLQDKDGNILPDCLLVPEHITALDFAYKIHTDIGGKFIRAVDMKTKQVVGKDHPLEGGDVIEIVTG